MIKDIDIKKKGGDTLKTSVFHLIITVLLLTGITLPQCSCQFEKEHCIKEACDCPIHHIQTHGGGEWKD